MQGIQEDCNILYQFKKQFVKLKNKDSRKKSNYFLEIVRKEYKSSNNAEIKAISSKREKMVF